jgi:hypothetical protein
MAERARKRGKRRKIKMIMSKFVLAQSFLVIKHLILCAQLTPFKKIIEM